MMRTIHLLFTLFVLVLNAAAQNAPVRHPSIPFELEWVNKPAHASVTPGAIRFTAGKETDLYSSADGSYYVHNVPMLLFRPDSNFIFSARLVPAFKNTYDGAAILVYSDHANWAKILFERNEDGTLSLGASFVKNKHGDDSYHATFKTNEVYVKVVRAKNTFCFYYATDGKNWKLVRTFPYDELDNMRIGFYAQSPKGPGMDVTLSDIHYKNAAFKNFFTGE